MERINAKVKKWGNSFGIILPRNIVKREKIKEGLEVNIIIQPNNIMTVSDLFQFTAKNKLPKIEKNTNQLMKEIDRDLWPE